MLLYFSCCVCQLPADSCLSKIHQGCSTTHTRCLEFRRDGGLSKLKVPHKYVISLDLFRELKLFSEEICKLSGWLSIVNDILRDEVMPNWKNTSSTLKKKSTFNKELEEGVLH